MSCMVVACQKGGMQCVARGGAHGSVWLEMGVSWEGQETECKMEVVTIAKEGAHARG